MTNFWQTIKKPVIGLAPMDGITDYPMRQIQCSVAKPDIMYTEFIQAEGFSRNQKVFKNKLFFKENEKPLVCQLVGYTPEAFYQTVQMVIKMGFDGIDINMGCPNHDVVSRGAGGGLIGNYDQSEKIINQCLEALDNKLPLSIKTRIIPDPVANKEWFAFLSKFPLSEITIHGRPIKQMQSGSVNWEAIKQGAEIIKKNNIICLGNGGVKTILEAEEFCNKYQLDGILIGQAALGNPWVFKSSYQPTKQEILDILVKHGHLANDFYGPKKYLTILKHYSWYPKGFDGAKELRINLLKTRSIEEVEDVIAKQTLSLRT
ncbi:hypothetical protein COT44_00485 [Candidatus Shapirobacteria bacterium CG08_land_8_20_14_0_20_39_18]|uniref:tRNA-dihydrouridine synthase n=1 Tax=Candidatus Shapirobacteria bacterium CG08_land_8_20_14_0_20_39_18 TaxID=1974883 RepID=A0A2M6XEB0_9BACT|nr:MAG: hypothetical protein COT44_00485 [Candidatus Shapirobacteria bacterium CG08_land_8_20_14_0_20_39_18]PIY66438.1 MAG: hypothetical protein COY91_00655 [Candidatus Shapirobacteria bacterium CG_4_10_14_0_8_um_filter_39_15]PJE68410.1 MAG: hypothetical protein COU94_02065 [Candidatus Shapirobacteria bacterium CG10_big_fil_rev_8_21_14_0_10_38_8]